MEKVNSFFLGALGNAMHPELNIVLPDLEELEIRKAFEVSGYHSLLPLFINEVGKYEQYEQVVAMYKPIALNIVIRQATRTAAFLKIYEAFLAEGIEPIVMKGLICRRCYGIYANMRPSSDEDILIKKEEFSKVSSILKENEFICEFENVTAAQVEKLQEITFYNPKNGLSVEVHTNPIGHENSIRNDMNKFFEDIFDDPYYEVVSQSNGSTIKIKTMNPSLHFLFLTLHAFKHFTFYGFGIRQCLDILVFQETYSDIINFDEVYAKLEKVGALTFLRDIQEIGNTVLGFNVETRGKAQHSEELLEDIMLNGTFGNTTQAQRTAEGLTTSYVSNEHDKKRRIVRWLRTLFPSRARMISLNPEIIEAPWKLPIAWIQRWFRFFNHSKESNNLIEESMKISKRRVNLMKKYNIVK